MTKKLKLGREAKDVITGLTGILTGKAKYITGCNQYLVQPQGDGTKYPDPVWIDETRLTLTGKKDILLISANKKNEKGCDKPAPIK